MRYVLFRETLNILKKICIEKQIIGWEVYSQKGNSPELLLKSQIIFKCRINYE